VDIAYCITVSPSDHLLTVHTFIHPSDTTVNPPVWLSIKSVNQSIFINSWTSLRVHQSEYSDIW